MYSLSKTTLELDQLFTHTLRNIILYGKYIEKIILEPSVTYLFGKSYFEIQLSFSLHKESVIGKITQGEFENIQYSLANNSFSRTHIYWNQSKFDNHFNLMMETKELQGKYDLFKDTLLSFVNDGDIMPNFKDFEYTKNYTLIVDIDAFNRSSILKFRNEVLENFFYEREGILKTYDLSYKAYQNAKNLAQLRKSQEDEELQRYLVNRKMIAAVGDYCIVINQYLQPLTLMEITEIGNKMNNTYIGFEVKNDLKTGKRPIAITDESVACVFTKELFINIAKSLGNGKSKSTVIRYLSKIKDLKSVKYYNNKCFTKIR